MSTLDVKPSSSGYFRHAAKGAGAAPESSEFFLADAEHAALLEWTLQNQSRFEASGVGALGEVNTAVRKSQTLQDLGPSHEAFEREVRTQYKAWICELRVRLSSFPRWSCSLLPTTMARTLPGISTRRCVPAAVRLFRALSAVYYFYREPKSFSGGELLLFPFVSRPDETTCTTVEPLQNTMIVFPSWATHEVATVQCPTKAFADSRFAVNCWLHMQR